MLYEVITGRGAGVVIGTGMDTEIGKIADKLAATEDEVTPLQKQIANISKVISFGVIGIAVVIFVIGLITGREIFDMFFIAVSLAVAAIPEGLATVVTIVLAMGMNRMAKQGAIIRKLPAVETLGSTNIICSDKTGTLTMNKMTVEYVYANLTKEHDMSSVITSYSIHYTKLYDLSASGRPCQRIHGVAGNRKKSRPYLGT